MRMIRQVVALVVAVVISLTPQFGRPLHAQSGCCKMRASVAAPWGIRPDLAFAACREQNTQRDNGDNIFEPTGFVWWDRSCG